MNTQTVKCKVNGRDVEVCVDVRESLADMLRNRLDLTSIKKGCEVAECGCCTVLINGEAITSCTYLAINAEGKSIITVEGLKSDTGELSDIQQAFIDEAAVQCGFCTPGFIMAATVLVNEKREFTRDEIRKRLSGNLCRCTGYVNILKAVEVTIEKNLK